MKPPLALTTALGRAIGEKITDEDDKALAEFLLANVSAKVRFYGDNDWDEFSVPDHIYYLVLEVAGRAYQNPAGYQMERGDMTTFQYADVFTKGPQLTADEIDMCRASARRGSGWANVVVARPIEDWQVIAGEESGSWSAEV